LVEEIQKVQSEHPDKLIDPRRKKTNERS